VKRLQLSLTNTQGRLSSSSIASKTLCFEWCTVAKDSENPVWACIVAYNTVPSKKSSVEGNMQRIFWELVGQWVYIYAPVDNWWISVSFILRTAQHWLELNKEFSNSKHSYKSKCAISHTLQLIPFFSEWTSVERTHTHWVYLLSKVPQYIAF